MGRYMVLSVVVCSLNFVLSLVILSLSVYHLFTNESTSAPIALNEERMHLVTCLIPFSALWSIISFVAMFVSMTRSKRHVHVATVLLLLHILLFGISVYVTVAFENQLEMEDVKPEVLFQTTLKEIKAHNQSSPEWIPQWLDNIQKQSKHCCGVVTYHDYEEFWPLASTRIPHSCCREGNSDSSKCPTDLTQIPYPNTPVNFIKVESGCTDEINDATRSNIQECVNLSITMVTFLALGTIIFSILYTRRYVVGKSVTFAKQINTKKGPCDKTKGGETKANSSVSDDNAVIIIASSSRRLTSIDSLKKSLASVESFVIQERKGYVVGKSQSQVDQGPKPTQNSLSPLPIPKINKMNVVFAGLHLPQQQEFPEASTGEEMPVSGENMGSRIVFVAQDNTSGPPLEMQSKTGIQSSESVNDIALDLVHIDPAPISSSSPSNMEEKRIGKKKKGRKKQTWS